LKIVFIGYNVIDESLENDADRQLLHQHTKDTLLSFGLNENFVHQAQELRPLVKPDQFGCVLFAPELDKIIKHLLSQNGRTNSFIGYISNQCGKESPSGNLKM
jgi:hypothetical protein